MSNWFEHKGYIGSVAFSADDEVADVKSLKISFQEAVENYLAMCKQKKLVRIASTLNQLAVWQTSFKLAPAHPNNQQLADDAFKRTSEWEIWMHQLPNGTTRHANIKLFRLIVKAKCMLETVYLSCKPFGELTLHP